MAIKLYVGRMGSGKTYEVVSEVILGGLRRGRRVVSNIAGLEYEAMRELLISEGQAPESIGELVLVSHESVLQPAFWRSDKDRPDDDVVIQPGDLLALDEIWRFWEGFGGKSMPDRVMNFYRMHRHMVHPESGVACDVALITQDPGDLARRVRAVVEETYRMEKLTAIGSSKRYRVDVFGGARLTKAAHRRQLQRAYDPRYFCLYKSHSGAQEGGAAAVEDNIDQRGNVLRGALFRVVLPAGLVIAIAAAWFVWQFFHRAPAGGSPAKPGAPAPAVSAAPAPSASAAPAAAAAPAPPLASAWRLVGYYSGPLGIVFFATEDGRTMRPLVNPPHYKLTVFTSETFLPTGEAVVSWAAGKPDRSALPGVKP